MIDQRKCEMPGTPRRHHYVTKAYLDGFLEPNERLLFCYGRKRAEPFRAGPENLANIRDYHSFRRSDGTLDSTLEEEIGQKFESPGIPVIKMLSAGNANVDPMQRFALARLIALQKVRVPYERDFMDAQHKAMLEGYLAQMDEESRVLGRPVNALKISVNVTGKEPKSNEWYLLRREWIKEELKTICDDPRDFSRDSILELAGNISRTISEMQWTVVHAKGQMCFITSDCPVTTCDKNGHRMFPGLKDPETVILFPLSKEALLRIEQRASCQLLPREKRVGRRRRTIRVVPPRVHAAEADEEMVHHLNTMVASRSHLWTFSGRNQEWLLQFMQATSSIPKRTKAHTESELEVGSDGNRTIRTRKEFVVATDE